MDAEYLKNLLNQVRDGGIAIDDALNVIKDLPFQDMGFAKVDNHRKLRNGYPEVIYCPGKTTFQIQSIVQELMKYDSNILASRADKSVYEAILQVAPNCTYHEAARMVVINRKIEITGIGTIAVVTAGTADIPVAEEAAVTCEVFGNKVDRIYDVGVAGIHRLFAQLDRLREANVLIVVAGMEGALVSVVGGLVDRPVVAVPTSVGYGSSFNGLSALLTMLNSCASGVGVVNIDNGFGAGYLASNINKERVAK